MSAISVIWYYFEKGVRAVQYALFHAVFWRVSGSHTSSRGRAAKHDKVWVVRTQGTIIAACRYRPVSEQWLLCGVYVDGNWRGQGIAKRLLSKAITEFQQMLPGTHIYTFAYHHLQPLYAGLGFVHCEQLTPTLQRLLSSYLGQKRQLVAMYYA